MLKPEKTKKHKSNSSPCSSKRILQAVSILKQLNEKFYENKEKKSLLDDESENPIILQLTMKKVPPLSMQKFVKVRLPKSTFNDKNEVCLITGDLDKRNSKAEVEPDVLHFKELLKRENISQVNEVITLRQLRKEYKPFEARRQLCGAYDVFLCDKKIAGVLPRTLGKSFFKTRKLPIQINMQTPKLKEQVENALSSTVFHITCKGNSCASEVANLSMDEKDILSNVTSSIAVLKEQLPGQWDNVLGIYVKTPKSKAIPLYMSNDDPNDFNFPKKRTRPSAVTEELSTLPSTDVKVFKDGTVIVKRRKEEEAEDSKDKYSDAVLEKKVKRSETKLDELGNLPVSDSEIVINDTDVVQKTKKKSKKRKSTLVPDDEVSQVELKEENIENSQIEVKEEKTQVVKQEKKGKKRKSTLGSNEESSKVEAKELKPEKKKHKSDLVCDEESSKAEVKELKHEKKSKKHKSNLASGEVISVVKGISENSSVEQKGRKQNSKLNEESVEVKVPEENVENFQVKSKKAKHNKKRQH